MLNQIRLLLVSLFMGLFLIACGDESSQQDAAEQAAAPAEMTEQAATTSADVNEGMTEEEAVAKWGEPDIKQSYTIDSLTVSHYEWHGKDGITSVQFQNGKAKFSQFFPAE